ncbi:MAG: beta strand repeat-containing protein, partial [Gammaproteobacteria bacterium]
STVVNDTATTDGAGLATFAGLGITGSVGNYTLTFSAPALLPVTSGAIALAPGNAAMLAVTTQPSAVAQSGVAFGQQPVVQVEDSAGNAVALAGVQVTAAIASGGGALSGGNPIVTDASGAAVFTDLAITGTVGPRSLGFTASSPSLAAAGSTPIDLQAGLATTLVLNAGDNQSATAGTAVAVAPSVKATDASGNAVAGVNVTFAVLSGGGSVTPVNPVPTGSNGIAGATTWTLGATAGKNELTATSTSALAGSPVTFTATATVGAAVTIVKTGGDNLTGPILTTLGTPHEVEARDVNGNPVPGVLISWAAVGGSVNPTLDTTDALGKSTAIRTLGAVAGPQTTSATAPTLPGSPSVTFAITATAGGASQMVAVSGDNQTDTVGQTLPQPLVVRVSDGSNNAVSGVAVTWTVTLGNGNLSAPTSVTDASGLASINWTLGPLTNAQGVRATAAGAPVNFTATALPGPVSAAQSSVTAAPGTITASNGSSASTITVTARDANGNVIAGATVALSATGSNNTLTQPAGPTNGAGQATGTLSSTMAEGKTVSATINGTAVTQQAGVTVTPAAAAQLFVQQQPTTAVAGVAIAPAPAVQIHDAFGNLVTTATNQVTMTLNPHASGGTLAGTAAVMAAGGVATFANLSVDRTGTGYTLVASATLSGSPVSLTTAAFDITPAAATTIALVSGSGQTDTVAATLPNPFVVRVTDAFGNS